MKTNGVVQMRTRIQVVAALLVTGALALSQQENLPEKKQGRDVYAELAKAPEKARTRRNPLEGTAEASAAGRKLFQMYCAQCHGNTAEGGRKGPSLRVPQVQEATPGTLFWVLTNGVVRRGMPVWSRLPEPQRWQIVMYLKSLVEADRAAAGDQSGER